MLVQSGVTSDMQHVPMVGNEKTGVRLEDASPPYDFTNTKYSVDRKKGVCRVPRQTADERYKISSEKGRELVMFIR